ncbi:MAG TPA: hypothetical protein VFF30_14010 [Nitrososphaerales archaeon]|nr:hypothetical protein [Nitrososphaerales archaeon]
MRIGVTVIGAILLAVAAIVLIDGNNKLALYSACSTFQTLCPQGVSPTSSELASFIDGSKVEIVYGYVFGAIGAVVFFFGLIGRDRSGNPKQEEEEKQHRESSREER